MKPCEESRGFTPFNLTVKLNGVVKVVLAQKFDSQSDIALKI